MPDFRQAQGVYRTAYYALLLIQHGQDLPPGINKHGMTPSTSAILMLPPLSGCEHIGLILYCPSTKQQLPMSLSGCKSES